MGGKSSSNEIIPRPGETLVLAEFGATKRAALLFDRQYIHPYVIQEDDIPSEVTFEFSKLNRVVDARHDAIAEVIATLLSDKRKLTKNKIAKLARNTDAKFIESFLDFILARQEKSDRSKIYSRYC